MSDNSDNSDFAPTGGATELGFQALAEDQKPADPDAVTPTDSPVDLLGGELGARMAPMVVKGATMAVDALAAPVGRLMTEEAGFIKPSAFEEAIHALHNPAAQDRLTAQNLNKVGDIYDQAAKIVPDASHPELINQVKTPVAQKAPVKDVYDQTPMTVGKPVKRFADGGQVQIDPAAQGMLNDVNNIPPDTLPFDTSNAPARQPAMEAPTAPSVGTKYVNVLNPEGKLVSLPSTEVNDALDSGGYRMPSQEEVSKHFDQEKFGTLGQKILTGLEGAGEAVSFGTSPLLEEATGLTSAENIRKRREINPTPHMVGQLGGLTASAAIPGVGEANILNSLGEAGVGALGLGAAEGTAAKIGSAVVKSAIENMAFQGTTEEVSKLLTQDPNQTAQTAIADIGLAGLIGAGAGGVFGSVSPLWTATMGKKTGGVLKAVADKLGGIDGVAPDAVSRAIDTSGIQMSPEVRAAMSNDPAIQAMAKTLEQSDTTSAGLGYQQALKDFRKQMNESLVNTLGRTPDEISASTGKSAYEAGNEAKATLTAALKERYNPISEDFEGVKSRFKDLALPKDVAYQPIEPTIKLGKPSVQEVFGPNDVTPFEVPVSDVTRGIKKVGSAVDEAGMRVNVRGTPSEIADKLMQAATEYGWAKSPSSDEMQLINRALKELPLQNTLNDLRTQASNLAEEAQRKQLWKVGSTIRTIFRNTEDDLVTRELGQQAPELLAKHAAARAAYKDMMTTIDTLNDRLHVGRYSGPESFMHALGEMKPETILSRLSGAKDADMLKLLQERFPEVAQKVRDFHLDNALANASRKAGPGELISPQALMTNIDKMSPELKDFVLPAGAKEKLEAISILKDQLDRVPHNFSNTGRTIDKLLNYMPGSALGMASFITGHNPAIGFMVSGLTKYLGRDVPDAVRLSLLKFLGSSKPVNASGFKAMFDYTAAAMKGETALGKGVGALFKSGRMVLPESMMPTEKDRKDLDKHLKGLQTDSSSLFDTGGNIGHYLPDHGQAMAETAARVSNYLNSIRPVVDRRFPLDTQAKPNPIKEAEYHRALDIAQQPLVVLDSIHKGTVSSKDVVALKTMYPDLYTRMVQKMTSEIIDISSKGQDIPYDKRLSLSTFMAQPLDSTMTPNAILSAQPVPKQPAQPQTATQPASNPKRSTAGLNKMSSMYQTPGQASSSRDLKRQ